MAQLISIEAFIIKVATKTKQSPETIKEYLKQLTDSLAEDLSIHDKILIYKFGIFKKKWFAPRQGNDPNSGEKISIPGHYRISFTAAKALDDYLNQGLIEQPKIEQAPPIPTSKPKKLPIWEDDSEFIATDPNACLETEISKLTAGEKPKNKKLFFLITIFLLMTLVGCTIFLNLKEQNRINQVIDRLNKVVNPQTHQINKSLLKEFYQEETILLDRKIINRHRLHKGDTLYTLTVQYWQDKSLWPEMYILNLNTITDPDLIKPGAYLNIYNKPKNLSKKSRDLLIERYLLAYRIYKALGYQDLKNKKYRRGYKRRRDSVWILYTAHGYDQKLLKKYRRAIDRYDQNTLQKYINLFDSF